MYIYIIDIIPLNAIAALLCQKAIFSMLRRNSRSDIVIIFWATSFSLVCVDHVGAQRQRCALKLVQCLATWVRVFFNCFPEKKQMDTSAKVAVVISTHYGVISQHYGVISWNHGRIHFPLFLLLIDLQSPWRKGVLHCPGPGYWDHLFVSQAYAWWTIVPQPSQPLTFGSLIFGCPASKFPGYVKKETPFGNPALFLYATPI